MANAKSKPLSFSTTMRNPNRIAGFLSQIVEFEGQILTSEIIYKVIHNVIKNKLYYTLYEFSIPEYKNIYFSEELEFSDEQVDDIISNTSQNHKEAGFEKGWESRFDTWFSLPKEFGFVFYEKGKQITISETGHMLIENNNSEEPDEVVNQNTFLNSLCKYQTNNPFKKNLNANNPLLLLLNTIKLLKNDPEENGAGIYRSELSLLICWNNNDANEVYTLIKELRKQVGFQYSDEMIYDICLELLGCITPEEKESNKKYFKIDKICGEAVDEYIRKMRSTGILSLRGNGRFLDFNSFEQKKIDYVLDKYSTLNNYESEEEYFEYIGKKDEKLFNMNVDVEHSKEIGIKLETLNRFAKKYSKEEIFKELQILSKKSESKNDEFRFIPDPIRLEFLTSICLVQNLSDCYVEPNYSIDDEGMPTMTARGNMPDIVCVEPGEYSKKAPLISNVEVTMMRSKMDQVMNEMIPIRRHLLNDLSKCKDAFAVFIAPYIHDDAKEAAEWYKHKDNININPYTIDEFINKIDVDDKLVFLNEMGG
jgi:hypothetical protein